MAAKSRKMAGWAFWKKDDQSKRHAAELEKIAPRPKKLFSQAQNAAISGDCDSALEYLLAGAAVDAKVDTHKKESGIRSSEYDNSEYEQEARKDFKRYCQVSRGGAAVRK